MNVGQTKGCQVFPLSHSMLTARDRPESRKYIANTGTEFGDIHDDGVLGYTQGERDGASAPWTDPVSYVLHLCASPAVSKLKPTTAVQDGVCDLAAIAWHSVDCLFRRLGVVSAPYAITQQVR